MLVGVLRRAPGLAAERTLLLLDPRGTGASDPPADPSAYDLEDYAADIEAVRGTSASTGSTCSATRTAASSR